MNSQTLSEPLVCRTCDVEDVWKDTQYGEGFLVCHTCGVLALENELTIAITACVMKCPHCESVEAVKVYGGEEQCLNCGLDPNNIEVDTPKLAHLWKSRTPDMDEGENLISEIMLIPNKDGQARFASDVPIGKFLREVCGPHCSFAEHCPQTTKNFSRCYREEKSTEDETMSKRGHKKSKNKIAKAQRRAEKKLWDKHHSRAWLFSPASGWFVSERNYASETINKEQPGT